jgi:hypothetical protein
MNISRLIAALAQDDAKILASEFLAPRLRGQKVRVKINGVVCPFAVAPQSFEGWGVFKPLSYRFARLARDASPEERERYLHLLPAVRMLVAGRDNVGFQGFLTYQGDSRFAGGLVRISLADGVELFNSIVCRFDGAQFWFDGPDGSRSPMYAQAMRQAIAEGAECPELGGILPAERHLYGIALKATQEAQEAARRNSTEYRLADALAHAGAVMRSYIERQDGYTVEFTVNGEQHTSFVNKRLHVEAAGICLSGHDKDFDLSSLCGVIREGQKRRLIHHVGIREDEWDDE